MRNDGGDRRAGDAFDLDVTWRARRYQRWIVDAFGVDLTGRVLEVGAGRGAFTRWLAARATHVTAVEPEPALRRHIDGLHLANVSTVAGSVESIDRTWPVFDAAVLVNVLEHLDDDVAALRAVSRVLVPGGAVCILVPAHMLLFGTLDRRHGHRRRYTARGLRRLLGASGFRPERVRYFNPVGAAGWFVAGRVLRRPSISPLAVAVADHVVVPASRALEVLGDAPFGQSVLAVGRRRT